MEARQDENKDVSNVELPQLSSQLSRSSTQESLSASALGEQDVDVQRAYKKLIRKILKKDLEGMSATQYTAREGEILVDIMREADQLFAKSKSAQELLLDARIFKHVSRICRQHAEELSMNQKRFHHAEFAEKLIGKMGQGFSEKSEDDGEVLSMRKWSELGKSVSPAFNFAVCAQYLYGSFPGEGFERKPRAASRKTARAGKGATTQAQVVDFDKVSDNQSSVMNSGSLTDEFVTSTFKQLVAEYQSNRKEPVCYFSFVLDPESFGKSVENMFYVSFLIKEGKAGIFMDVYTGMPRIHPVKSHARASQPQQPGDAKNQTIIAITMDDWTRLKTALRLEKATLRN